MTTTNTVLVRTALHKKYYKVFLSDFYIKIVHVLYWYLARGTLGQDKLPFFSSRRTYFRPGLPHSRAQDVSTQSCGDILSLKTLLRNSKFALGFYDIVSVQNSQPVQNLRFSVAGNFWCASSYSSGPPSVACRRLRAHGVMSRAKVIFNHPRGRS